MSTASIATPTSAPAGIRLRYTLTASCRNRSGIMREVTDFIARNGFSIDEHQQFDEPEPSDRFFLRTTFSTQHAVDGFEPETEFALIAARFGMEYRITSAEDRPRIGVLVSREGHCLNDLVFRWRADELGGDLTAVMSNHTILQPMADAAGIPFTHNRVAVDTKPEAEDRLRRWIDAHDLDFIVLARYMQVLSDEFCRDFSGRIINIHHSFLPGFKGARPYQQAFDRGVKYVGATAHYVTADLDEGPIIEQEVIRVTHAHDPAALARIGRDAEALALSRAVRWHCQRRVILNGTRTVVFA